MASDEVAFGDVWVAGEDERGDTGVANLADLRGNLIGVADDGDARPTAGATNTSPQVAFDVAVGVG